MTAWDWFLVALLGFCALCCATACLLVWAGRDDDRQLSTDDRRRG